MYPAEDDVDEPVTPKASSDLAPRILSALVMIPAALAALYFGGYVWLCLAALCSVFLCLEWAAIVSEERAVHKHQVLLVTAVLGSLFLSVFLNTLAGLVCSLGIAIVLLAWGSITLSQSRFWVGIGVGYLGIAAVSLAWLRFQSVPNGLLLVLFLLVVVWATDIGAYFAGRSLGGPKIFPSISPKKTWSGSIGGVLIAAILAMLFRPAFGLNGAYIGLAIAGIGLSCVSQAGDAFESFVKRRFDVKDSGSIIPGHGGVLDRLDALLLAAPVMAACIWLSV